MKFLCQGIQKTHTHIHRQYENITFPHRQVVINANTHTKYEVSMTMWAGEQIKEKYQKICHLKNTSQND